MVTYYNLNDLIKKGISDKKYVEIVMHILNVTLPVKTAYPEYKNWFLNKHIPNIGINRNTLFAILNNEIVGVVNIKYNDNEKKICTLYVKKGYRYNKVGTTLLKMSFELLGTSKPLITISDDKLYDLKKFIINNNWEISQRLDNYYAYNHNEYVFNGLLYVPIKDDENFKIYRKDNNSIIKIIIAYHLYLLKNLIYQKKEV